MSQQIHFQNWSEEHKRILERAEATGDNGLARCVRLIIEKNIELYAANSRNNTLVVYEKNRKEIQQLTAIVNKLLSAIKHSCEAGDISHIELARRNFYAKHKKELLDICNANGVQMGKHIQEAEDE